MRQFRWIVAVFLVISLSGCLQEQVIPMHHISSEFLDPGFSGDGVDIIAFVKQAPLAGVSAEPQTVQVLRNGKIVVAGETSNENSSKTGFAIARYLSDGSLDKSFGRGGKVVLYPSSFLSKAFNVLEQEDSKLLVVGRSDYSKRIDPDTLNGVSDLILLRLLQNGEPDLEFGQRGGLVTTFLSDYWDQQSNTATLLADDGFWVATTATQIGRSAQTNAVILKYSTNGTIDESFGEQGRVGSSPDIESYNLLLQNGDKLLLVGRRYVTDGSYFECVISRFALNGVPDPTFGESGEVSLRASDYFPCEASAVQQDGKIVVAGASDTPFRFVRLLPDGQVDNDFATNVEAAEGERRLHAMTLQPDGKIIALGETRTELVLTRYLTNGETDSSFGEQGTIVANVVNGERIPNHPPADLALQKDGAIVITGNYDLLFLTARFLPN